MLHAEQISYAVTKNRAWGTAAPTIIGLTPCPNNSVPLAIHVHVGTLYQPLINGLTPCPNNSMTMAIQVGTLYQPLINGLSPCPYKWVHFSKHTPCPTIKWHTRPYNVGTTNPTIIELTPCRKQLIGTWPYLWVRNIKYIHIIVIHVEYLYNEYNHR